MSVPKMNVIRTELRTNQLSPAIHKPLNRAVGQAGHSADNPAEKVAPSPCADLDFDLSHDARQEDRPSLALPVVVCGMGLNGKLFFELTRTLDVSRSGCRVHIRTQPQMESPLAVRLIRRGDAIREESVQILCRVVWLRQDSDGWLVGAATLRESMV